jgi:starch-binding outer membrane protein, SusD/RagB family
MKRNFLFFIMLLSLLLSACRKNLLSPPAVTFISQDDAFASSERTLQQVLGMYAGVKTTNFNSGRFNVNMEIRSEEFLNATLNVAAGLSIWEFTVTSSNADVQLFWNEAYLAINRCNIVNEGVDKSPVSAALKDQYKAEARFLRALCYYSLVTLYARPYWDGNGSKDGVPLRLTALTAGGSNNLSRSKVAEVYTQILADLDFAESKLPLTYSVANDRITRAHRNAAIALKTRVYLTMGQYDKVVTEANKIVPLNAPFVAASGIAHQLLPSVAAVFTPPYTTNEAILLFAFSILDFTTGAGTFFNPSPDGSGHYPLNPAGIVGNTGWKSTDARRTLNRTSGASTWLRKWPKNPSIEPDYASCLRYAEVLLNLAEALVRVNNTVDARAVSLINAIRQRSDPTTTFAVGDFATPQALLSQIEIERRIELLGEGFRSNDRVRLGLPLIGKGPVSNINSSDIQYIWPIPLSELLVNKSMVQNAGY